MVRYLMSLAGFRRWGSEPDRWTIYGRRYVLVRGQMVTAAVHRERITSAEEATAELMKLRLAYPNLDAVVVHLREGKDRDGYRTVIHRVGKGKAWWE